MSTSKIAAGSLAAAIVILGLTLFAVHELRPAPPAVIWKVPQATVPTTQQAQQQVRVALNHFIDGFWGSGGWREGLAVSTDSINPLLYSRDVAFWTRNPKRRHIYNCQFTVTSCTIEGNNATLLGHIREITPSGPDDYLFDGPGSATLVNIGGRWLVPEKPFGILIHKRWGPYTWTKVN